MNILVLGNGFDIAHGLPTKYEHFLKFVEVFERCKDLGLNKKSFKEEWEKASDEEKPIVVELGNLSDKKSDIFKEIKGLVENNMWIQYFFNVYESRKVEGKDGWIDFESEISEIVKDFDDVKKIVYEKIKVEKGTIEIGGEVTKRIKSFLESCKRSVSSGKYVFSREYIAKIKKDLLFDLKRLIRCLELYLVVFINTKDITNKLPDIEELAPQLDNVLSFNYTNTFQRMYRKDMNVSYIHGEAKMDSDVESCNMVVGIDEYLKGDEKNTNVDFIQFKKFFQRIYKKTGNEYKDWVRNIVDNSIRFSKGNPIQNTLYIIGHSLDVTDKDILKELILAPDTTTTIFYYNQEAMASQIANLVKVIGQDELIERVHRKNPKIIFIQQK